MTYFNYNLLNEKNLTNALVFADLFNKANIELNKILFAVDMEFFEEYKSVMSPIAMSLDILQGEEKAYMGRLLPTLAGVLLKLKSNRNDDLNYYLPLLGCLIQGLNQGN